MQRLGSIMLLTVIGIATTGGSTISQSTPSYIPPNRFVPDAATAVRIAEAVWIPIYGADQLAKEGLAAQPISTLAALTVPESNLPDGCRLNPAVTNSWMSLPTGIVTVPSNPWSGADHRLKAAVRSAVDGPPQMPDAPPLDRRGMASFESKWADDVVEAYHAEYVGTSGGPVLVSAVRFKDANHAIEELPGLGAQRSLSARFVRGAMAIRVSGGSNLECFQAVSKYLQSLR